MDGFHQDHSAGERHKSGKTFGGLLAAHCDPLKWFEFTDCLLDATTSTIEPLWEVFRLVFRVGTMRYHGNDAPFSTSGAVPLGNVTLVGDHSTVRDVWPDVQ